MRPWSPCSASTSPEATKAPGWCLPPDPVSSRRATDMRSKTLMFSTVVLITAICGFGSASATSPRFYRDDPIVRGAELQEAGGAAPSWLDLMYELSYNLFALPRHKPSGLRAQNVNTVDE